MPVNTGPDSNTYTIPEVQLGDTFNYWKDTTNIAVYKLNKIRIYDAVDSGNIGSTYGTTGAWKATLLDTISTGHTFSSPIVFSGGLSAAYAFVSLGATVGGNLTVSGGSTLAGRLNVGGVAILGGGLTVSGNLFVSGGSTLAGRLDVSSLGVATGVTVGGNLTVSGGTTLSGRLDIGSISVSAGATIGGNLTVSGGTTLSGRLDIGSISVSAGATIGGNLTVSGGTTLSGRLDTGSLSVSAGATVGGNLTVTGGATLGSVSVVTGVTVSGNMTVTGGSTFSNRVNASSVAVVNGVTVGGNLTVTGGSTLSGRLDANTISVISSNNSSLLDPVFNNYSSTFNRSNLVVRANAGTTSLLFGNGTSGGQWIQAQSSDTGTKQRILSLNPVGGNVGIGTTGPTVALDVNGAIKASDFASGNILTKPYAYNDATYPISTGANWASAGAVPSLQIGQTFTYSYTNTLSGVYVGKSGETWICFCKFGNDASSPVKAFTMLVISGSVTVSTFISSANSSVPTTENANITGWRIA